jgi:uncharacterized protein YndB with AHSA1/START domain
MDRLSVEAQAETTATPQTVWALVKDADTYSEWGPWCASGDKNPGEQPSGDVGTVRWLGYQRTTTVEQVTEAEPGRRLAYTVLRGIPVRDYRAEVTLTPTATGTCLVAAAERGSPVDRWTPELVRT